MKYKKIPWWQPQIGSVAEKKYIAQALKNHYANEGELAAQFEKKVAALLGVKYAIVATSGTVAIFLALKAVGVGHGDEVIVPDATFIATTNAVTLTGAKPVLVDIDPATLNIDPIAFRKAITSKTKAVVPVHVTGRAANMEKILEIANNSANAQSKQSRQNRDKKKIFVIEDAAEAFMSKYHGKFLGTWGLAGCFSFSAAKTITTGQGGMVVTNDQKIYETIKPLKDQGRPFRGTGGDDAHPTIGFNFKYTDVQASLGLGQLKLLNKRIARMRQIHKMYSMGLKDVKKIRIFPSDVADGAVPQWTDALAENRNELDAYLRSFNIDCRRYWLPIHLQKSYPLADDNFSNSVKCLPKAIWLPSAFTLTDKEVNFVISKIREFYNL